MDWVGVWEKVRLEYCTGYSRWRCRCRSKINSLLKKGLAPPPFLSSMAFPFSWALCSPNPSKNSLVPSLVPCSAALSPTQWSLVADWLLFSGVSGSVALSRLLGRLLWVCFVDRCSLVCDTHCGTVAVRRWRRVGRCRLFALCRLGRCWSVKMLSVTMGWFLWVYCCGTSAMRGLLCWMDGLIAPSVGCCCGSVTEHVKQEKTAGALRQLL